MTATSMIRGFTKRRYSLAPDMKARITLGWQCPECAGVRINTEPHQPHDPYRFQCQECGCQWSNR
jgi:hypothetical protein